MCNSYHVKISSTVIRCFDRSTIINKTHANKSSPVFRSVDHSTNISTTQFSTNTNKIHATKNDKLIEEVLSIRNKHRFDELAVADLSEYLDKAKERFPLSETLFGYILRVNARIQMSRIKSKRLMADENLYRL